MFHHPNSQLHDMGPGHLEAPIRTEIIGRALSQAPFPVKFVEARKATMSEILAVHHKKTYILLQQSQAHFPLVFTPDTIANQFTYKAAITAVGGAIQTGENIGNKPSYAMLRPPGHHATFSIAMGFCFFNNIAISVHHLLEKSYNRIAIIDIDNHHGNGTQEIFEDSADVLYTSLHANPKISFPGTGYIEEVGIDDGEGYTVNIPLPFRTRDHDYLYAFDSIIGPIVREFKPDAIMVSLGFDGLDKDPYGALGLSTDVFLELGARIGSLAKELCKHRVGVILEGGYKYEELGIANNNFFNGLLYPESIQVKNTQASDQMQNLIYQVKSTHRNYWYDI